MSWSARSVCFTRRLFVRTPPAAETPAAVATVAPRVVRRGATSAGAATTVWPQQEQQEHQGPAKENKVAATQQQRAHDSSSSYSCQKEKAERTGRRHEKTKTFAPHKGNKATRHTPDTQGSSSCILRTMSTSATSATPLLAALLAKHPRLRSRQDPSVLEATLRRLVDGGRKRLQFVVDFDYTLTRAHNSKGEKVDCSWGVMENSPLLPKDYTDSTNAIKAKYLPIEHDPKLTIEEKTPFMVQWYTEANKVLQDCGVNRKWFPKMVAASNVEFRDDTDKMLSSLHGANVPVLILSAGLGDLVVEILQHFSCKHKNVHVVSNFLDFAEDGRVTGIRGEMIHVFNKNESVIHDSPYFKDLEHRKNIVLMGDSVGDLRMADGVKDPEALLKIGFLNDPEPAKEKLDMYLGLYDLLLVDDQTMHLPNDIIGQILEKED